MTVETKGRFVLFPIQHPDIWEMYKKAEACFWTAEELDLAPTSRTSRKDDDRREALRHVRDLFRGVRRHREREPGSKLRRRGPNFPGRVASTASRSPWKTSTPGVLTAYRHLRRRVAGEKRAVQRHSDHPAHPQEGRVGAAPGLYDDASFAERLVALAAVEGIFFSGSFCAIFWLKHRGLMPGLCRRRTDNYSRDEGMHCDFACLLYGKLEHPLPESRVREIIGEAVEHEIEFVTVALDVAVIGMNKARMSKYIRFCADRLLVALGLGKMYRHQQFEWMTLSSRCRKTNCFRETRLRVRHGGGGRHDRRHAHVRRLRRHRFLIVVAARSRRRVFGCGLAKPVWQIFSALEVVVYTSLLVRTSKNFSFFAGNPPLAATDTDAIYSDPAI